MKRGYPLYPTKHAVAVAVLAVQHGLWVTLLAHTLAFSHDGLHTPAAVSGTVAGNWHRPKHTIHCMRKQSRGI